MQAIKVLMNEHRIIENTLDAMETWAGEASLGNGDNKGELRRFVTFFRDFVDACHHVKEEDILFAAMTEHGFSRQQGPIAVMLHEHEQGRAMLAALDRLASQDAPWGMDDLHRLVRDVGAYAALLRQHILKEDSILYPMAEAHLPEPIKSDLVEQLETFEQEEKGSGEHQRLHRLADSLIAAHARGASQAVHVHHH